MTHAQPCGAKMIPAAALEEAVEAAVLRMWGHCPLPMMTITPGSDPGEELAAVQQPQDPDSAGITLAEYLARLDRTAKGVALRNWGVRVTASIDPRGRLTGWIQVGALRSRSGPSCCARDVVS